MKRHEGYSIEFIVCMRKMAAQSSSQGSSHQKCVWVIEFLLFVCKNSPLLTLKHNLSDQFPSKTFVGKKLQ